jgi:hypothetical protein
MTRRFKVTVSDADTCEVLALSEEPGVELRYLVAEGRDIAEEAYRITLAQDSQKPHV